jgi:hypothetical protein
VRGGAAAVLTVAMLAGVACVGLGVIATRAVAADPVKFYEVTASYAGKPENLSEIAVRFLGGSSRAGDIFALNVDRPQPGGGYLSNPGPLQALHPGWYLQLPWDAVGVGVRYGDIPTTGPAPKPTPSRSAPGQVAATTTAGPIGGEPAASGCAAAPTSSRSSNWAALRMAPEQAWALTRGQGVIVAVIDSGVDASLPELSGRVAVGSDVVTGSGRGNTDCLGSGTAMASIIVGQPDQTSTLSGIAPQSTVLPVRVAITRPVAAVADQASAVEVAVAAGASVVALGSYVDSGDPTVASAVSDAVRHNVVVVAGAPTDPRTGPSPPGAGVLRVGGVGVDNTTVVAYRPGDVDVVAPGVDITILGISGTGEQSGSGTPLAVAFAAGEAALVRSAHPGLTASQVVHRIEATADRLGPSAPDARYGWGLINPSAAVTAVLSEETPHSTAGPSPIRPVPSTLAPGGGPSSAGRTVAIVVVVMIGLAAAGAFAFRLRHVVRAHRGARTGEDGRDDRGDGGPGRRADWVDPGQNYAAWDARWAGESTSLATVPTHAQAAGLADTARLAGPARLPASGSP